jgi:uncharacterized protein YhaN
MDFQERLCLEKGALHERLKALKLPGRDDTEFLKRQKEALKSLKSIIDKEREVNRERHFLEEQLDDLSEEKRLIEGLKISKMGLWFGWGAYGLFFMALPPSIYFLLPPWDQKGLLAVLTPLSVLLLLIRFVKQRLDQEALRQEEDIRKRRDRVSTKWEGLEKKREVLLDEREGLNSETETRLALLCLERRPSREELDKMIEEVESEIEQLNKLISLKDEIADKEKQIREAEEKKAESEQKAKQAEENWSRWLGRHLLDPALSPEGALEMLSRIESCRDQVERINRLRSTLSAHIDTKNTILETVNRVTSFLSRGPVLEENLLVILHDFIQEFEKADKDRQQRNILTKNRKACRGAIQRLEERQKELRKELSELMAQAGVEHEEEFIRHAETYEKRQALIMERERCLDRLHRLTRGLAEPDSVIERMSAMDQAELEGRKEWLGRELTILESRLEQLKEEKAKSLERSQWLTNDERTGELRYEEQILREELAASAEEWCVNRLALALMRMARTRFEKDRQPDVIWKAADIFHQMTLGRYGRLLAPIGENDIEILDRDNMRKGIDQLSRGTAEQLYLSLRFGFIQEFSKHSPAFPVIMDDILVNFDPRRAEATIRGMMGLSSSHQILFFTCHPETVDLFKKAGAREMFFHISNGKINHSNMITT